MKMLNKYGLIFSFALFCVGAVGQSVYAGDTTLKLPKLIDFGAKKCVACKKMEPILEELKKYYSDNFTTKFVDVWKKENIKKAKLYKIQIIPTQIFFDAHGKELWRHVGFISKENILKKWLEFGYKFEIKKSLSIEHKKKNESK